MELVEWVVHDGEILMWTSLKRCTLAVRKNRHKGALLVCKEKDLGIYMHRKFKKCMLKGCSWNT